MTAELQSGGMKPPGLRKTVTALNQLKVATALVLCFASAVCVRPTQPVKATPNPIASRWVDLPEAPFVAQVREGELVLAVRPAHTFSEVGVGCVLNSDGKAHVVATLLSTVVHDGTFEPNRPITGLIQNLTNPDRYRHLSGGERCPPESFFAVTVAVGPGGAEKSVWNAEGTAWTGRR